MSKNEKNTVLIEGDNKWSHFLYGLKFGLGFFTALLIILMLLIFLLYIASISIRS